MGLDEEEKVDEVERERIRGNIEIILSDILSRKYDMKIKIKFVDEEDNK